MQVLSIACCVFFSHCGNQAPARSTFLGRQWSRNLLFEDLPNWFAGWQNIHQAKELVCTQLLGTVGSAQDYPVFSKWVLYGEVCKECLKKIPSVI
jgi:hypothetical protein